MKGSLVADIALCLLGAV